MKTNLRMWAWSCLLAPMLALGAAAGCSGTVGNPSTSTAGVGAGRAGAGAGGAVDGPTDLPGDAAGPGTNVASFSGGGHDCSAASTSQVSIPWISQKLSSLSWSGNMCCGPASALMAKAFAAGQTSLSESDLKAIIDWMAANETGWKASGYKCDPHGTDSDVLLDVLEKYAGLSPQAVSTDWCSLVGFLDGQHVVIFLADAQGDNGSTTFVAGDKHWLVLDRIDGAYTYVNDPGRTSASQGQNRQYTTKSVRARFEARGGVAVIVPTTAQPPCGGLNQPCCNGSCSAGCCSGSLCVSGNAPSACGSTGQACATCSAAQSCQSGQCTTSCGQNACTLGQSQCNGSTVQTCVQQGGCHVWQTSQICSAGQTCQNGQCSTSCPGTPPCSLGQSQCNGNTVQTCVLQGICPAWQDQPCPSGQSCQNGQCSPICNNPCSPGAVQCNGNAVQTCVQQGSCYVWQTTQTCSSGQTCQNNQCTTVCNNPCSPGAVQCSGNAVETCVQQGSCYAWQITQTCPAGEACQNSQCVPSCSSYQTSTKAPDYTCGGGIVMNVHGSIDASGTLTVSADKAGATFGAGDYYVWVFNPNDGVPGNHCKQFNAQKDHITVSSNSQTSLSFPSFPSQLTCGGGPKGYCVSKAGSNGDNAWFCSNELVATYQ